MTNDRPSTERLFAEAAQNGVPQALTMTRIDDEVTLPAGTYIMAMAMPDGSIGLHMCEPSGTPQMLRESESALRGFWSALSDPHPHSARYDGDY